MFDKRIVNNFCIENMIPPCFPLKQKDSKKTGNIDEDLINEEDLLGGITYNLPEDTTIKQDIFNLTKTFDNDKLNNLNKVRDFTEACKKKYGKEKTSYFIKYLFKEFLNYY